MSQMFFYYEIAIQGRKEERLAQEASQKARARDLFPGFPEEKEEGRIAEWEAHGMVKTGSSSILALVLWRKRREHETRNTEVIQTKRGDMPHGIFYLVYWESETG